ncbi:hypothetical protein QS541_17200, partial [Escherichia coli]|nr:hypothetical protein [Escherichia coli]
VHWLAEKPDGKGSRSPFAIFPVRTVLPDTLIHEPDWHWPPCQSGVWRTSGSSNGSYSNLGSHRGSFSGRNTGSGTLFVYASGGNSGSAGGDCANTSRLQGYVAGALISTNASNNPAYGKTAFISFAVPVGATYQITSYPTQNYSCGSGVFSVYAYQM